MNTNIVVMLNAASLDEFERISAQIRAMGFEVRRTLPRFKILVGSAGPALQARLRDMPEVKAVEDEGAFQLAD